MTFEELMGHAARAQVICRALGLHYEKPLQILTTISASDGGWPVRAKGRRVLAFIGECFVRFKDDGTQVNEYSEYGDAENEDAAVFALMGKLDQRLADAAERIDGARVGRK